VVPPFGWLHHAEREGQALGEHQKHIVPGGQGRDAMSRAVQLSSLMSHTGPITEPMTATRAITICLIALFTTATWGVMIHFGTLALGFPIGAGWLTVVLAVIFLLVLLVLSMAVMGSDYSGDDELNPPPGAGPGES
jgi:hypothetical protein